MHCEYEERALQTEIWFDNCTEFMIVRIFRVAVYTAAFSKLEKTATKTAKKLNKNGCFTYSWKDNACQQGGIITLSQ